MLTAPSISLRWTGPALAWLFVLTLACGPARVEEAPARVGDDPGFDVLIYVLDACRADRIGAYGYERPTTPAIDALATDPDTVAFTRHYVAANWTKPATASLFTGTYMYQHGVTDLPAKVEGDRYKSQILADEFVTLAESFRAAGFATLGLVTSLHLTPEYGFDQGFEAYFDPNNHGVGDGGRISKLTELIQDLDSSYFAYVHQNACHHPFEPKDRDPEFMAEFGFAYDEEARSAAGVDFTSSETHFAIRKQGLQLTAEDVRFLSLVYDAKLRKVDRDTVAPMIEELRRAGRWDRTLFILTADHGEELYEHRGYAHAHAVWEEVIHVPLIVKFPRGMRPSGLADRDDTLSSNVDLYPSLLAFLGRPIPEGLAGRPIFDSPEGGIVLSQGVPDWAVLEGRDKLIEEMPRDRKLFDLEADPGETQNLAGARPERAAALSTVIEAARARGAGTDAPEIETQLSPEAIETLRSLGYLN